jgi:hypothetical protein
MLGLASASEYTATVFTPRRLAVAATRQAISPQAIFLNIAPSCGEIACARYACQQFVPLRSCFHHDLQ